MYNLYPDTSKFQWSLSKLYCLHFGTTKGLLSLDYSDTKEKPDDSQAGSGVMRRIVSSMILSSFVDSDIMEKCKTESKNVCYFGVFAFDRMSVIFFFFLCIWQQVGLRMLTASV